MAEGKSEREKVRRKQIVDAARTVFAVKGFNGATTKEIAREAGIAEGTIYRYFKTKKELLLAVVSDRALDEFATKIQNLPWDDEAEFLKQVAMDRMEVAEQNIENIKLLLIESQFHPEIREKMAEDVILQAITMMEKYVAGKIDEGQFRPVNVKIAVRAFAGMVQMFVLWRALFNGKKYLPFEDDEIIDTVVDIFINGIRSNRKKGES